MASDWLATGMLCENTIDIMADVAVTITMTS